MDLKKVIRTIPDYPKPGIEFYDITTLMLNATALEFVIDKISQKFSDKKITKVVGLEARGFIIGAAVAVNLSAGFVPIRKKGKLPSKVVSKSYQLEYGTDTIEIHQDAISDKDVVLIHDDVLATGGTAFAAWELIKQFNPKNIYFSFLCDLKFLNNQKKDQLYSTNPDILVNYK